MSGVCGSTFFGPSPWGPGEGSKVNYKIRKVDFKDFIPNFMFVLKNKRNGIFIMSPGSYSRGWDLGLLGGQIFFYKHGRVAYQIEGNPFCSPFPSI